MPEYQYKCKKCNIIFTIVKSMMSSVEVTCPQCYTKDNLQKIYFPTNVVYNGDGFYNTDSRMPPPFEK